VVSRGGREMELKDWLARRSSVEPIFIIGEATFENDWW